MNTNLAYQEEWREELISGEIVAMSPRPSWNHNQVSYNIATLFANYLKGQHCHAFCKLLEGKKCAPVADGMALYLD